MSDFMFPPVVMLETMEDVRAACLETTITSFDSSEKYRVKSVWLIALIDEIAAGGRFSYNSDVKRLAESGLGLPPRPDAEYSNEGDTLSTMIYNAQRYRRSDLLIAKGFLPFTDDVLRDAYETGKRLDLLQQHPRGSTCLAERQEDRRQTLCDATKKKEPLYSAIRPAHQADRVGDGSQLPLIEWPDETGSMQGRCRRKTRIRFVLTCGTGSQRPVDVHHRSIHHGKVDQAAIEAAHAGLRSAREGHALIGRQALRARKLA